MARPCKNINLISKHLTKEEKEKRQESETQLKGRADNINPPEYLNKNQVNLFNYIKNELEESKLLSNLDIYILSSCVIAIDRLQFIESKINNNPGLIMQNQLMSAKDKYTKDFYRCCNELSLSPQSRAKLANINLQAQQEKEDPLLKVLREDDED
ncbi:phage terminase small subunit P27 family [Clostridium botulinum]|uniref:phage terminase small subunit P27 family n=1 Tax=Clostridium botulinum TaxID=1491 RepID=UPI001375F886|nr:phage terminase small subunit P27 family [Clostridium botulinum]MCJ8173967.1 phage terminase small subunit P27 family [Clostridium botulinum]NCI22013.1 phage terminase small subunit P27 family [Clostridium botulinum]NCI37737.1 phage terminase small subunit P27 family [Clostridium botulinum]NCI74338.1 phage terminase small subunit P27 family [Clostridium botulinum]NDI40588.1 phage terminase small subunit P27 family [Clostridium botulinum]